MLVESSEPGETFGGLLILPEGRRQSRDRLKRFGDTKIVEVSRSADALIYGVYVCNNV